MTAADRFVIDLSSDHSHYPDYFVYISVSQTRQTGSVCDNRDLELKLLPPVDHRRGAGLPCRRFDPTTD